MKKRVVKNNEVEAKKFYDLLVSTDDLSIFFRGSLGSWQKDKTKFIKYYNENSEFIEAFKKGDLDKHFFNDDFIDEDSLLYLEDLDDEIIDTIY